VSQADILSALNLTTDELSGGPLRVSSPVDGATLANLPVHSPTAVAAQIDTAAAAFRRWRDVPAPRRGELVRLLGDELRTAKDALGALVSLEAGKIREEGRGEVQEMIDICDFAVGLSRQLYGLTIASERPGHTMRETWHPAGVCAVITAFNFPVAVWCWNSALALVCGDPVIWKPSEKTPLTALATMKLFDRALARFDHAPEGLASVVIGGADVGRALVEDNRVAVVSATGSTRMGRSVGPRVAERFGKCILELGGNNAMIVAPSADLELALRAVVFSAVGTAGQRCTTLRRLIVHESIHDRFYQRLEAAYRNLSIGNPLTTTSLVGPLIDQAAYRTMQAALVTARQEGGKVFGGERVLEREFPEAYYVRPALVQMATQTAIVREETFAPILYVMKYRDLTEAIDMHNAVAQGLSSCIFSTDVRETETFLSASGSDCGIANVNIGPSGAEIGGAFGGEKDTGGGRESGSDAWKAYMRRQTNTVNYSRALPLAQGIKFDI
jgi:aldehyde dehydrogenase (NAD+)